MPGKGKKQTRRERLNRRKNKRRQETRPEAASQNPEVHDSSTHGGEGRKPSEEKEISLKEVVQLLQNVQQTLQEMRVEVFLLF